MTTITDYCNEHGIKWFPIRLKIENGEKQLLPIKHECYAHKTHYMPSQNDFVDCSEEVLQERQRLFSLQCDHIAMDTSTFYHIDIDTPDYDKKVYDELALYAPYFTSTTKPYGKHILVIAKDNYLPSSKRPQTTCPGVEMLCGQWSYAPKNGIMFNADKPIPEYDIESILAKKETKKQTLPTQTIVAESTESATAQCKDNNDLENYTKFQLMKDCFCKDRLNHYAEFIRFTICVKLCFGDSGKQLWDEICKKSSKYNREKNNEIWNELSLKKEKKMTFGSLCWWARTDNPVLYEQIFGKKNNWTLSEAVYAQKFKEICFDNNIVFTGKNMNPEGFLFNGVYWEQLSLHNAELQKGKFDKLYQWYLTQQEHEKKEMPIDTYMALKKEVNGINSYRVRTAVLKIFKAENYESHIEWNKNPYLFIFEDAVFDLSVGTFVEANPLDYMNVSCGKKWNVDLSNGIGLEKAKAELVSLFRSCVHSCDYEYIMYQLSLFLEMYNRGEKGFFWLRCGGNGKGTITNALRNALGNYWGELQVEYYTTSNRDADRPNQNLYNCRYARVLNSSEVDRTDANNRPTTFNSQKFCQLTGQDPVYVRELGTKETIHYIAGTTLIQLNVMPEFKTIDDAIRRRVEVWEFPNTFTDDAILLQKDPIRCKRPDKSLKEKLRTDVYRIALLSILFEYYTKYQKEGLAVTPNIVSFTKKYIDSHLLRPFIEETYEYQENSHLDLRDFQINYQEFYNKHLSIKQIKEALEKEDFVTTKQSGYYQLRHYKKKACLLVNSEQEEEEYEEIEE